MITTDINYQKIFNAAPGLYLILKPDLTIAAVNEAYLKATLTQREQITGHYLFDVFPDNPDDKTATGEHNLRASLNYVLQHKLPHTMAVQKYDIRTPEGNFEERYWSPINTPILNEEGEVELIIHRVEDVTAFVKMKQQSAEQKEQNLELQNRVSETEWEVYKRTAEVQQLNHQLLAEADKMRKQQTEIAQLHTLLQSIISNTSNSIWAIDTTGKFLLLNKVAVAYFNKTPEECIGKTVYDLVPFEEADAVHREDMEIMASGKLRDTENTVTINGEPVTFLFSRFPLRDAAGNITGLCGVATNITERVNNERKITELNNSLQKTVQQLEEVNTEMKSFTYSVSHDLRAPLRAISSFSTIIRNKYSNELTADCKRLFDVVDENARLMSQLIDDLLNYSRVGRAAVQLSETDLTDLAQRVLLELRNAYTEVKFNAILKPTPKITCDGLLMKQVLQNLLSNAVKYSSHSEQPVVEFNSYATETEQVFYVKDNGAGFDMRYYNKLFGMFQRLHSQAEFEGTGVGLAIVQRILQKHGGKIWAESEVNKGATFYFSLPHKPNYYEQPDRSTVSGG